MKQILSAVLISAALLTGTLAYSHDAKPIRSATKEISISSAFQKIDLGRNFQLVLVQDPTRSSIIIEGDEKLIPAVNVSIDKGLLTITSKQNFKGGKIKIYVPVTNLTSVNLASEASVASDGVLKMDDLTVIVNDGSTVALSVIGNLQVEPAENCDLEYERYNKSIVTYVQCTDTVVRK